MKKLFGIIALCLVMFALGHAQGGFNQTATELIPGLLSTCPPPAVGHYYECEVTGVGREQSVSGAPYAPMGGGSVGVTSINGLTGVVTSAALGIKYTEIVGTPAPGVTSFNGLTGPVTSAAGQIKWADLLSKPTGLTCTTATHSNSGIVCPPATLTFQ